MRLNRFIASSGICSRRKADILIVSGLIYVNGSVKPDFSYIVSDNDIVEYQGQRILLNTRCTYILNKPRGFISSNYDKYNSKTIFNLIDTNVRLFSIGRLDIDTTGIILLTNDGDLSYKLSHPKFSIEKKYFVQTWY